MNCRIPTYPRTYYAGDTNPAIIMSWKKKDLTPYTLELRLRYPDDTVLVKPSTIMSNSSDYSQHKWDWIPSDLIPGKHHVIIRLIDSLGEKVDIAEFYLKVRPTH